MMKQAVTTGEGNPLDIVETSIPEAPKHGVLVQTAFAGVCHTDLGFIKNWVDLGAGKKQARSDFLTKRGEKYEGVVLGHEISGRVAALGEACTDSALEIGDRVVVYPWIGCGICVTCVGGFNNLCDENHGGTVDIGLGPHSGGYAEYVSVPNSKFVIKIPDVIPLDLACLLPCSGLTAYWALMKVQPYVSMALERRTHARILIIGAGGLGLWGIKLARIMFADKNVEIIAADISQDKLELALNSGANNSVLMDSADDSETLASTITARGTRKFDGVLDFVGMDKTTHAGMISLQKSGTLVMVGLFGGQIVFPVPRMVFNNLSIQGSRTGPVLVLKDLISLLSTTDMFYPALVHYPLEEINGVHDKLRQGKINGRALIKFG